jgi:hypothetical protein
VELILLFLLCIAVVSATVRHGALRLWLISLMVLLLTAGLWMTAPA